MLLLYSWIEALLFNPLAFTRCSHTMEVIQGKSLGERGCTIVMIALTNNLSLATTIHTKKTIS